MARVKPLVAVLLLSVSATAQVPARDWRETANETIWTGRYRNCDYGYSVNLPAGIPGHDPLPPAPNHGFGIDLREPGSDKPLDVHSPRMIWVWNAYAMSEPVSLEGEAQHAVSVARDQHQSFRVDRQSRSFMDGLKTIDLHSSYEDGRRRAVEEDIVALRIPDDVVYQFTLVTEASSYALDEQTFRKILMGFQTPPIRGGACSND